MYQGREWVRYATHVFLVLGNQVSWFLETDAADILCVGKRCGRLWLLYGNPFAVPKSLPTASMIFWNM